GSQVSPGSRMPLPQLFAQLPFGVCTHRKEFPAESQESSVQALLSSQSTCAPLQELFAQTSPVVQGSPSSQGKAFAENAHCAESQVSVVHGFPSSQSPFTTQGIAPTLVGATRVAATINPKAQAPRMHVNLIPSRIVLPPFAPQRAGRSAGRLP